MSESFADYYDDMNGKVFEDWFENVLLPKLTKERKYSHYNGQCQISQEAEKTPSMNMKKYNLINPLTTNVPHQVETSQLIYNANQLTGFYMMMNIGC